MAFRKTLLLQRLLQIPAQSRCHVSQSAASAAPGVRPGNGAALPSLVERLREMKEERIRLEGVVPPPAPHDGGAMSVEEARKVLRVTQMERVREKLRGTPGSSISYERLVEICGGGEGGKGIARALDESGAVLVLGDIVFHRPDQVARAVAKVIPLPSASPATKSTTTTSTSITTTTEEDDPRHLELLSLERRKADINARAEAGVRRELWCGLAFMVAQTAGFMRLTFWELSWDVMEPICFYVGSVYFMAGYAFFLRTAKDPSFEGFYQSRLAAHRRRLMAAERFDLDRLRELRRALGHARPTQCSDSFFCSSTTGFHGQQHHQYGGCSCRDGLLGVLH